MYDKTTNQIYTVMILVEHCQALTKVQITV